MRSGIASASSGDEQVVNRCAEPKWTQKQGVRFQHPLILLPIQLSAVLLILDIKEYKCSRIYRHKHINNNLLCTHFEFLLSLLL